MSLNFFILSGSQVHEEGDVGSRVQEASDAAYCGRYKRNMHCL
jgi:hypothetical protein